MDIAFVNDAVYPYVKGGVEKRINELARRLADRGHHVELYGLKWWDGDDVIADGRISIHGAGQGRPLYTDGRRSINEAISFAYQVYRPLARGSFDVVDCQNAPYFPCFSSKIAALVRNRPMLITWHEVWGNYWYQYLGHKGLAGCVIEKVVARLTDHQVAVSESTKRDLVRLSVRTPIEVITNGIDFKKIQQISAAPQESDIIFAGRLIREKGVDLLIRAISLVVEQRPDVRCLIVGDGPEREQLQMLVQRLGLCDQVRMVGFVEQYEDLIALMRASKVFALPSVREGFGIVVLEAYAAGISVVTVDHPMNAAKDLVSPSTGGVCAPDCDALAAELLYQLEHPRSRTACVERAEAFDWDLVTSQLERYYERITE